MADEKQEVAARLDMHYVAKTGKAIAFALRDGEPIEVSYTPGDMTCYQLIFTPLHAIACPAGRVTGDPPRESPPRCEFGVGRALGAVVVAWIGHGAAAYDLKEKWHGSYVGPHFGQYGSSGWALALLFESITENL